MPPAIGRPVVPHYRDNSILTPPSSSFKAATETPANITMRCHKFCSDAKDNTYLDTRIFRALKAVFDSPDSLPYSRVLGTALDREANNITDLILYGSMLGEKIFAANEVPHQLTDQLLQRYRYLSPKQRDLYQSIPQYLASFCQVCRAWGWQAASHYFKPPALQSKAGRKFWELVNSAAVLTPDWNTACRRLNRITLQRIVLRPATQNRSSNTHWIDHDRCLLIPSDFRALRSWPNTTLSKQPLQDTPLTEEEMRRTHSIVDSHGLLRQWNLKEYEQVEYEPSGTTGRFDRRIKALPFAENRTPVPELGAEAFPGQKVGDVPYVLQRDSNGLGQECAVLEPDPLNTTGDNRMTFLDQCPNEDRPTHLGCGVQISGTSTCDILTSSITSKHFRRARKSLRKRTKQESVTQADSAVWIHWLGGGPANADDVDVYHANEPFLTALGAGRTLTATIVIRDPEQFGDARHVSLARYISLFDDHTTAHGQRPSTLTTNPSPVSDLPLQPHLQPHSRTTSPPILKAHCPLLTFHPRLTILQDIEAKLTYSSRSHLDTFSRLSFSKVCGSAEFCGPYSNMACPGLWIRILDGQLGCMLVGDATPEEEQAYFEESSRWCPSQERVKTFVLSRGDVLYIPATQLAIYSFFAFEPSLLVGGYAWDRAFAGDTVKAVQARRCRDGGGQSWFGALSHKRNNGDISTFLVEHMSRYLGIPEPSSSHDCSGGMDTGGSSAMCDDVSAIDEHLLNLFENDSLRATQVSASKRYANVHNSQTEAKQHSTASAWHESEAVDAVVLVERQRKKGKKTKKTISQDTTCHSVRNDTAGPRHAASTASDGWEADPSGKHRQRTPGRSSSGRAVTCGAMTGRLKALNRPKHPLCIVPTIPRWKRPLLCCHGADVYGAVDQPSPRKRAKHTR